MAPKEYQFYTVKDLALDESFQNWVLTPDVKNKYFWDAWLREHPEKEETVNKAIELVSSVQFRSYQLSNDEKEQLWDSLWDKMEHEETDDSMGVVPITRHRRWTWKYAAAVLIGIIATLGIWKGWNHSTSKTISFSSYTHYGESKSLILPDSSEVILNANSRIVYNEQNNKEREVWLEGEAFFHVRHTTDSKKFIVHSYDKLSVEVLGTRFNVNTRGKKIEIVLQQGSIKLDIDGDNGNGKTQLYLKPGEMIQYNKQDGDYTKTSVDAAFYNAWSRGRLAMNNYSLDDAAFFLKETFGEELVISDQNLLATKISGAMPIVYNIDTMLVQFGKAFNVHFSKKGDEIWVQK
ncbi:MAG: FecR domain-containing protein [Ginsengibacter sp.]